MGNILVLNVCPWWKACIFSKIDAVISWKLHTENHLLDTKSVCRTHHLSEKPKWAFGSDTEMLSRNVGKEMCACLSNWSSCTQFLNSQTKTLLTWQAQLKEWSENTELPTQWFEREMGIWRVSTGLVLCVWDVRSSVGHIFVKEAEKSCLMQVFLKVWKEHSQFWQMSLRNLCPRNITACFIRLCWLLLNIFFSFA